MKELLRLFKAVQIDSKGKRMPNKELLTKTMTNGFLLSPEIIYNYSDEQLDEMTDLIISEIGLSLREMNNAFHKSWEKVRDASMVQLVLEQLIHYITTYGFEELGIYNEDSVYIPGEKLELPDANTDRIILNVVKGYTLEEIKDKVIELLKSGIALKEDTVKDVVEVAKQVGIDNSNVDDIKNKEVRIALCDHLGLFPKNPSEFLRYVIYKTTGRTLLIKDAATIAMLKEGSGNVIYPLFDKYEKHYGLHRLASIFFRFKPLFLAMKSEGAMKPVINKIRKLTTKHHRPMKEDYLNTVTAVVKNGLNLDLKELEDRLGEVNAFRKIRLAYALNYRTLKEADSILYKIRNGKGFASPFEFGGKDRAEEALNVVLESIVKGMRRNVSGKKVFIPGYINYALPATEKQFTGNLPSGTCVSVDEDIIFGIHWHNVKGHRIDLDLSLMNVTVGKIGWDASYRTNDRGVLFSGDMTDAKGKLGASELFYVKEQQDQSFIMLVNYYNYRADVPVPLSIVVGKDDIDQRAFKKNYMIHPDKIVTATKTKVDRRQRMLGLLVSGEDGNKFYFSEADLGDGITAINKSYVENTRKYLTQHSTNAISLNDVLVLADADLTDNEEACDINLSPVNIEKDTIIQLLV